MNSIAHPDRPFGDPRRSFSSAAAHYTVRETDVVILTQFGKQIGEPVTEAGLHWKLPFIQSVNRIEKRLLEWDGPVSEMPTKDKTYISVEAFARWRIHESGDVFREPPR